MGVWRYKKRGFGEDPGEDWDPPNVSVLVPVKNEEKVIGRLLESLVRLEYPRENLEVIVVEDESVDRTLEICRGYSQRYPWIKVFHRDSSLGKGDALNYAFHQSKGEIVATFDADDIPEPLAVTKALRYFNNPETGAVHGYHRVLNLRESVVSRLAADALGWWGHAGCGRSRGSLEVDVCAGSGGCAGVDGECDTGGADGCWLSGPRGWDSEGGTACRHTTCTVICHGCAKPRLRWQ